MKLKIGDEVRLVYGNDIYILVVSEHIDNSLDIEANNTNNQTVDPIMKEYNDIPSIDTTKEDIQTENESNDVITPQDKADMREQQIRLNIWDNNPEKRKVYILRYLKAFTGNENVDVSILNDPKTYRNFTKFLSGIKRV